MQRGGTEKCNTEQVMLMLDKPFTYLCMLCEDFP